MLSKTLTMFPPRLSCPSSPPLLPLRSFLPPPPFPHPRHPLTPPLLQASSSTQALSAQVSWKSLSLSCFAAAAHGTHSTASRRSPRHHAQNSGIAEAIRQICQRQGHDVQTILLLISFANSCPSYQMVLS